MVQSDRASVHDSPRSCIIIIIVVVVIPFLKRLLLLLTLPNHNHKRKHRKTCSRMPRSRVHLWEVICIVALVLAQVLVQLGKVWSALHILVPALPHEGVNVVGAACRRRHPLALVQERHNLRIPVKHKCVCM